MTDPTPLSTQRKGWLTPSQMRRLGRACATLLPFGDTYHVGSTVMAEPGTVPRDIDLRLLLDSENYARLTPQQWRVLADHIGRSLEAETGIGPIDFQVQDVDVANREHPGIRSAIFALGKAGR